jgi:hypothetical protein
MTNRIYINYDAQEYYISEDELYNAFEEYKSCEPFEEWLNDKYTASDIFNMNEEELQELEGKYDNFYDSAVKEWAEYYLEVVNLSAEVSVS